MQFTKFSMIGLMITTCLAFACVVDQKDISQSSVDSVRFNFEEVAGIGYEKGISRRDPSDILTHNNHYYVWYTKIPEQVEGKMTPLYNSGYYGTIWYATSADGYAWVEKGQALDRGVAPSFDSHAVFTPNILKHNDRFYLFYTGTKPTPGRQDNGFGNNSETDITGIGVAVADSPDGPFLRFHSDPVIEVSPTPVSFDSYRVDDAALVVRDQKVWLYYKGRSRKYKENGPRHTAMGVAFAERPEGPYTKHPVALLDNSHEVLIWNQDDGISALASLSESIFFAANGLDFSLAHDNLKEIPAAPGLYRQDLTDHSDMQLPDWGISHLEKNGHIYLVRFNLR